MRRSHRLTLRFGRALVLLAVIMPLSAVQAHAADSVSWHDAWAMGGHDPQRTFRSPAVGPTTPHLLSATPNIFVSTVGPDGVMYGEARTGNTHRIAAFTPDGRIRLLYPAGEGEGFELVLRRDGALLAVPVDAGGVLAFCPQGTILWSLNRVGLSKGVEPLVTAGGYLYAAFIGHAHSGSAGLDIFANSGRRHRIEAGLPFDAVARAPDGRSYAIVERSGYVLQALDRTGRVEWANPVSQSYGLAGNCICLLIGAEDTVYSVDNTDLVATDRNGHRLWQTTIPDGIQALAQRTDGSLLVAGHHVVVAVTSGGGLLWTARLHPDVPTAIGRPSLITDQLGTVDVGTADGSVHILAPDGREVSTVNAGGYHFGFAPSMVLGPDGRLIVNGTDNVLRVYVP